MVVIFVGFLVRFYTLCLQRYLFFYKPPSSDTKKNYDVAKKRGRYDLFSVIRLGLEPKTPTLKVLCSTN